jgi:hypothetical protein
MDYDEDRIYYSHQNLQATNNNDDDAPPSALNDDDDLDGDDVNLHAVKRHFREFLSEFLKYCI